MKHYKKVTEPAREVERHVLTTCDFCGAVIKDLTALQPYDVDNVAIQVTMRHKKGEIYPEGGMGVTHGVDMCSRCWEEKLVPWIAEKGVQLHKVDWDY